METKVDLSRLVEILRAKGVNDIHVMHHKASTDPQFFVAYEDDEKDLHAILIDDGVTLGELIDTLKRFRMRLSVGTRRAVSAR